MIGPITCSRDFIQRFRRVRQGQPGFQPRLFIDYDLEANEWKPTRFDGINRSPSPEPSTSQSNQAIQPFPERGSAFTKYRSPKGLLHIFKLNFNSNVFSHSHRQRGKSKRFSAFIIGSVAAETIQWKWESTPSFFAAAFNFFRIWGQR